MIQMISLSTYGSASAYVISPLCSIYVLHMDGAWNK